VELCQKKNGCDPPTLLYQFSIPDMSDSLVFICGDWGSDPGKVQRCHQLIY
jgi:hypothetical protein